MTARLQASVIVPSFQRTEMLADALKSLVIQTHPQASHEVIVVDNNLEPDEGIRELVASLGHPNLRLVHEPRNGLHFARHRGALEAKSDLLLYVDDDVLAPPEWIGSMIACFDSPAVAMVAGRSQLHFEVSPPEWIDSYRLVLSELEMGDEVIDLPPNKSAVGCNMGVQRSSLLEVGGFNPDGFGDRRNILMRGDGEGGLARKFHDRGWKVRYCPNAVLEHRVPESRMQSAYLCKRARNAGIEASYARYRYGSRSLLGVAVYALKAAIKLKLSWIRSLFGQSGKDPIRAAFRVHFHASAFRHAFALLRSRRLREHVVAPSYWEENPGVVKPNE